MVVFKIASGQPTIGHETSRCVIKFFHISQNVDVSHMITIAGIDTSSITDRCIQHLFPFTRKYMQVGTLIYVNVNVNVNFTRGGRA